jgi:hydroxymethylbilane synthase
LWQAEAVKTELTRLGYTCEIITYESTGDAHLLQPIYAMGISGVFTKQLDIAVINKQADIAVHSLKDVPTRLAENLFLAATLPRGAAEDVVIIKDKSILDNRGSTAIVATGSLRRKSQWLAKYPKHNIVPIRGNVQTRLKKLWDSKETDAVIFAKAGLERLGLLDENAVILDWMLPAPAQGIVGITCRDDDPQMKEVCGKINHHNTFIEGSVERQFLQTLMGGCSVPLSAWARIQGDEINFDGAMHAFDGSRHFRIHDNKPVSGWQNIGAESANRLLQQLGANELLLEIRNKKWDDESALN